MLTVSVNSCDALTNWMLFFTQKNENRFYLKEVNVSMILVNGSGKQYIGLGGGEEYWFH